MTAPGERTALVAHLAADHPRLLPAGRRTRDELARIHGAEHHHYACTHYHAGANLGPGSRPPGWRTGADVVHKGLRTVNAPATIRV